MVSDHAKVESPPTSKVSGTIDKQRHAERAKLDPAEERASADERLQAEAPWPAY